MKHYTYNTKYFHADLFNNDNCIIDNEICNDISKDWNYLEGVPIVVGFLHKNQIDIFLAETPDDKEFEEGVKSFIRKKVMDSVDLYSFNKHMEIGNFKGAWNITVDIKEIKPFMGRGWTKDKFYNELIAREVISDCKIVDVFQGDASLCITKYNKFLETGKIEYALEIVKHNMNCVLKESVILKHQNYFRNNYQVDERGWVVD